MYRDSQLRVTTTICLLALATCVAALLGCGGPAAKAQATDAPSAQTAPEPQVSMVGADGAKLMLTGVSEVIIPPAALSESVNVSVAVGMPALAPPLAPVSEILALTPHGRKFAMPIKISLHYQSDAPPDQLSVLRLADDEDGSWEPVGGVQFADGLANFESTTFSYYAVVKGFSCTPVPASTTSACGKCRSGTFCSSAGTCVALATTKLCDNKSLYVIYGVLPDSLTWIDPAQTTDGASAQLIATLLSQGCSQAPVFVSQAAPDILDPCNDAPLLGEGTTLLVVGGGYGQRVARYLDAHVAPIVSYYDEATHVFSFVNRAGVTVASSTEGLSERHDFFMVQLAREPLHGAFVIYIEGLGWDGTPAATWYFSNVLYPQIAKGTRTWHDYLVVEWTDDGDGTKNAADTFTVLASE